MTEYAFISIAVRRRREGLRLDGDYQDVIRERAAEGWAFVQAIDFSAHIEPRIDLVFSRKVQ